MSRFVVIQDTREKNGWNFDIYDSCIGTLTKGLKTGDYTIEGREDFLIIERKATTAELALNLGKKRVQFEAELERMLAFRHAYIVCEFSESRLMQFPKGSTIPRRRWRYLRMNGKFMRRKLHEYEEKYGVEIIFCEDRHSAEEKAIEIFEDILDTN
jgi:hypothetical protein